MRYRKRSPASIHRKKAQQARRKIKHQHSRINAIMRLILTAWLLTTFVALLILYIITRNILLLTSYIGLITIVFIYFFNKE